jgi:chemotaxis protein methyltransferase CheR
MTDDFDKKDIPSSSIKTLTQSDYRRLSDFIYTNYGIKIPPGKKSLLESRLQKRLRTLNLKSFTDYTKYVLSPEGIENELIQMMDLVTTNKTDFFREPSHFEYLINDALPELIRLKSKRKVSIWSAGCSTGEEPYTLGIVLNEFAEKNPGFYFSMLATDLSTKVLKHAIKGIYEIEKVEPIPLTLKKKYLLKHKDKDKKIVRIAPELRNQIEFRRLNFMDNNFGLQEPMDIIFCRNVIIYFDRQTQEKLLNKFYNSLSLGGYLFIGHSETLTGMTVPFVQAKPTIYRRTK